MNTKGFASFFSISARTRGRYTMGMIDITDLSPWQALYAQPLHARTQLPHADLQRPLTTIALSANNHSPYGHSPVLLASTPAQQALLAEALAALPPGLLKVLNQSVLGIGFARDIGLTAWTDMVTFAPENQALGCVIVLDSDLLDLASANAYIDRQAQGPLRQDDQGQIAVTITPPSQNPRLHALRYSLLQACGQVLAIMTDVCPASWSLPLPKVSSSFGNLSWQGDGFQTLQPAHDFPLRMLPQAQTAQPTAHAATLYTQLANTPFPTWLASRSPQQDFAECFASYVHTQQLGQPYAVTLNGQTVFSGDHFWRSPRAASKKHYMQTLFDTLDRADASETFLGLAPFLRMSLSGADLKAYTQRLLAQAQLDQDNAILWMNLATGFLCLKMREMGLAIQAQALELQRLYRRPANCQPPRFRLLLIMTEGDLSENTPIDCLLENSPVELLYYYATPQQPLPQPLPAYDAVMVTLSDSQDNRGLLLAVQAALTEHAQPVINPPHLLPQVNRDQLSERLQGIHGLEIPRTQQMRRSDLLMHLAANDHGAAQSSLPPLPAFPMIIRPVGSQAGNDLAKVCSSTELATYLAAVSSPAFFVSRFVDYSSQDGQFRKYRIAMLRGVPFISHMAISSDWMVHYVNAGMYDSAEKRAEEGSFMQHFSVFATRHQAALAEIYQRLQLDYLCIDCAETKDGQLLIFEIDHIMAVHAMDSVSLFPFKAAQIAKLQHAFEQFLYTLEPQPQLESAL